MPVETSMTCSVTPGMLSRVIVQLMDVSEVSRETEAVRAAMVASRWSYRAGNTGNVGQVKLDEDHRGRPCALCDISRVTRTWPRRLLGAEQLHLAQLKSVKCPCLWYCARRHSESTILAPHLAVTVSQNPCVGRRKSCRAQRPRSAKARTQLTG